MGIFNTVLNSWDNYIDLYQSTWLQRLTSLTRSTCQVQPHKLVSRFDQYKLIPVFMGPLVAIRKSPVSAR